MNAGVRQQTFGYILFLILGLTSCVPHRQLVLLSEENVPKQKVFGKEDTTITLDGKIEGILPVTELLVKPDDILYIFVYSLNPEVAAPFNIVPGEQQRNSVDPITQGYLVDLEGYIDYPILGRIQVEGLGRRAIKEKIEQLLVDGGHINEPVVKVRFLNFTISVLGEVRRPGRIQFDEENVTILEAISQAGDFGDLANREKVLIIREAEGERRYAELNLLNTDVYNSPFLYLQQNDIIYVEPLTAKTSAVASAPLRYLNIFGTVVGTIVGVILIIERLGQN